MIKILATEWADTQNELGEGPFWHAASATVFWVDILGQQLCRLFPNSGELRRYACEKRPSLLVDTEDGRLLVAVQGGLYFFDCIHETWQWIMPLETALPNNRCNDGGCDSQGRLWVGTMDMQFKEHAGSLYVVNANWQVQQRLAGLTISNGIAWSADDRIFYHIDSPTRQVRAYAFQPSTGELGKSRVAIEIPTEWGQPDGMAMDEEGMLWVAVWGGFGVYRFNPATGECLAKIEVPVPQVSSCAFVGENLDRLVITTAWENMGDADRSRFPESGNLFVANPGVKGMPKLKFGR